jgi:tryptophanyl-tRNA synthetase
MSDTILTGIRSNEEPTLANYLGAFVPMVEMQRQFAGQYQINMFVPDLHSFTTPIDHAALYQNTLNNIKYFIAAGLDLNDEHTYIYRQSYVPAHSELTWILDCFTYMGEMGRMTQFKEKSGATPEDVDDIKSAILRGINIALSGDEGKNLTNDQKERITEETYDELYSKSKRHFAKLKKDNTSVGLFNYPVLMAADILLYGARWVPVGEDQFQHLEIARDIATRMNNKFGDLFVIPEATAKQTEFINRDKGLRIRSLTDPTKKMSKSSDEVKSKILLMDDPAQAAKKIMGATTDNVGVINYDWDTQPGIANLLQLLSLLNARNQAHVNTDWEGKTSYNDLKKSSRRTGRTVPYEFPKTL